MPPTTIRLLLAVVLLVILALDFAALDDITTGNEPGFAMEWAWLTVSTIFLGALSWILLRRRFRGGTGHCDRNFQ